MVDKSDVFANSLTKLFILRLLDKQTHKLEDLIQLLEGWGHPKVLAEKAIQRLLDCNIISSKQGVKLLEHRITELSTDGTTLCSAYLRYVVPTLYYVQSMAYLTPLAEAHVSKVPKPQNIENDDRTFRERIMAAAVLLDQVESDLRDQEEYLRRYATPLSRESFHNYGMHHLLEDIRIGIRTDLAAIERAGGFPRANWTTIREMFV